MIDNLGDRMKEYEAIEAKRKFMPMLPIIARIDGRSFHSFTKGMKRPYDIDLSNAMIETTRLLVEETNASVGYTQSDEITLIWEQPSYESQVFFNGRISKMTSQLAALATLFFYREIVRTMPAYADRLPSFDARVWQVPNRTEAVNVLVWREWDATKNSISMAAQSMFSHKQLHGKNGAVKQDMMMLERGINWNDYPTFFKRGTYVQRRHTTRAFTTDELDKLPTKHKARTDPNLMVERTEWQILDLPPINRVVNREDVIFCGADPITAATKQGA